MVLVLYELPKNCRDFLVFQFASAWAGVVAGYPTIALRNIIAAFFGLLLGSCRLSWFQFQDVSCYWSTCVACCRFRVGADDVSPPHPVSEFRGVFICGIVLGKLAAFTHYCMMCHQSTVDTTIQHTATSHHTITLVSLYAPTLVSCHLAVADLCLDSQCEEKLNIIARDVKSLVKGQRVGWAHNL